MIDHRTDTALKWEATDIFIKKSEINLLFINTFGLIDCSSPLRMR